VKGPKPTRPRTSGSRLAPASRPRGLEPAKRMDESSGLLDEARSSGLLEENQNKLADPGDTATTRKVTRMPKGIEVVEHRTGVAEGQWLLQIHCQCGRRWFELEAVPPPPARDAACWFS